MPESVIEEWRSVVDFEGKYEVSSLGRVRSIFTGWHPREVPVILKSKPVKNGRGYRMVVLSGGSRKKSIERVIHRLVAMAFHDNPDNKPQVAHLNGKPDDNRACNLVWATQAENEAHKEIHGYRVRGNSVLTKAQVAEIKRLFPPKPKWPDIIDIAKKMGVSRTSIYAVINGKTWSDVGDGRFLLKPIEDANIPS